MEFPSFCDRILLQLAQLVGDDVSIAVDPGRVFRKIVFVDPSPRAELLDHLRDDGLIEVTDEAGGHIRITEAGLARVRVLRDRAETRTEREEYARWAVLHWIHEASSPDDFPLLIRIDGSHLWWFYGVDLEWGDVLRAVRYLRERGLMRSGQMQGHRNVEYQVCLTADGEDLVASGLSVRDFLNQKNTPSSVKISSSTLIFGDANQSNVVGGHNNTQTTSTGVDGDALGNLIAQLTALLPNLSLPEDDAADLQHDVDALKASDDPPRRARLWRNIKRFLGQASEPQNIERAIRLGKEITPEHIEAVARAGEHLFALMP